MAQPDRMARRGDVQVMTRRVALLRQGELVSLKICGGGGFGPSLEWDPDLVLRDVIQETISLARARERYGVVINPADGSLGRTRLKS